MAKWLAVLLILAVAAAGAFYLLEHAPQREALAAAQARTAEQERQLEQMRARVSDLEAIRDQLQQTSTELQQQIAQKESPATYPPSPSPARGGGLGWGHTRAHFRNRRLSY